MQITVSNFELWKNVRLTVEENDKILKAMLGHQMFKDVVGISDQSYRDYKKRARQQGTYSTAYIFKFLGFLKDNNVKNSTLSLTASSSILLLDTLVIRMIKAESIH